MAVTAEQRGGRDRLGITRRRAAGAFEWLPAHELAPPQLVNTGITGDAEQPGFDFKSDGRSAIPGTLRLLPRGQRQVITVVRITHKSLDLSEHGGIVRGERFFDGDRIAARLGHKLGLGCAHSPTIGAGGYHKFMVGLRKNYGMRLSRIFRDGSSAYWPTGGMGQAASGVPSSARRWTRPFPVSATYR